MSATPFTDTRQVARVGATPMRDHWMMFFAEGALLLILGVIAITVPLFATLGLTIILGWVFLISGIMGMVSTFWARHAPGFRWSLISALLAVGVGVALLAWPLNGAVSLTLLLGVFCAVEGLATLLYAFDHRRQLSGRSGWMFGSGILDVILAAVILVGLPQTAAWALGFVVGIKMIFGGLALVLMSLHARAAPSVART